MLHYPVKVYAGFLMHADPVGTGIDKGRNVLVGILDHQVNIQWHVHVFTQGGDHGRTNRDVGHKVTVHHIDVQNCCPRRQHGRYLFCKTRKISRQNRWRQFDQAVLSQGVAVENFITQGLLGLPDIAEQLASGTFSSQSARSGVVRCSAWHW